MRNPARRFAAFFVLAAALPATVAAVTRQRAETAAPSTQSAAIERFARQIAADVTDDDVGGITAGVFVGGEIVWARGFGWADRDRHVPADRETIYRVGSISKSFTAVALAQLAGRGVLNLDDRATSHLPALAGLAGGADTIAGVTLRRLASHTAGLIREPELPGAAAGPIAIWEKKVLASIPTTAFLAAPGERYSYSNIGFGILGLTISRAAGTPFMELLTTHIIEPLEMDQTVFVMTPELYPHLSVGYAVNRAGDISTDMPALEHWGRGYKVPNGAIYSTVRDLARFAGGVMGVPSASSGVEILTSQWRREVMRVQTPEDPDRGYGLGFTIHQTESGGRTVGHGGSVAGYNAYLVFHPESTIGVVMLRNYGRGNTNLGRAASALLEELVQEGAESLTRHP
jgi:CubicO group peptidase (beta-lactamase class C family)